MRSTNIIASVMVIIGLNLITFATTRYWTTKHVLTIAEDRMLSALRDNGLSEQVYSSEPTRVGLVIPLAGGMYYWWNNAIPYWALGFIFVSSGIAVTRYKPKEKIKANKTAHPTAGNVSS